MSDRKTVITHLQIIHTWAEFARERDLQFFTPKHLENIAEWTDDALTMLKEQEAKPVRVEKNAYNHEFYFCPKCDRSFYGFFKRPNYCDMCGQAVKWDD